MNQNPGTDLTDRGIQTATISVSLDNVVYTPITGPASYTQASGLTSYIGEDYSITASNVRYVQFAITSNHGSADVTGISEIRFTGDLVPEPSAALLLLGGLGALTIFRRRRIA